MSGLAHGFTLLELMVAILIFTVVIGSIYFTLTAGVESFHRGEESMEVYQGVRVGLSRFGKDLRRAVSPQSPWSNLAEDDRRGRTDPTRELLDYSDEEYLGSEIKENDIRFVGDSRQVTFVVQDVVPGGDPVYDLREIQYSVDSEKALLIRRTKDSIMLRRMMDWRALHSYNETEFRLSQAGRSSFEEVQDEIAANITDLELGYFDGEEWRDYWDSNEIVEEEYVEETFNESGRAQEDWLPGEEPKRLGLPFAVRVVLKLTNAQCVQLMTEIPAKDMDRFYNESDFRQGG